ncbi:MAG: decaprenyl-phosphate phosphoribosyltransferase [Candidatus Hodarchaeota archaeon]
MIIALIESMRPKQWSKNLLLFVGIIFSQNILQLPLVLKSVAAFGLFCIISGSIYILNDLADIESDRAHPLKSQRPLASGRLKIWIAAVVLITLISASIPLSFILDFQFGIVVLAYFLLILAYSLVLKHVVILDVMIVTLGIVLRAIAGAVVIHVKISSWLLICTIFLALFLTLCKRRHELVILGDNSGNHRKSLIEYNPYLLDQMIAVVTASAVISYALYTTSQETVTKFGTRNLIFTLPFVIYGIFRYLYLVHQKNMGGSPELIFIKDRSMIINIVLYCVVVILVLYLT